MKVIAIVCEAYSENLGDAFIYEGIASLLEEMGCSVVCVDLSGRNGFGRNHKSEPIASDRPGLTSRIRRFFSQFSFLRRLVTFLRWNYQGRRYFSEYCRSLLRDVDGVIIGGGQIITDTNLEFPVRVREVVNICRKLDKPYSVFSVGVGGNLSFYAKYVYSDLLKSATFISARGVLSASRMKNLGPFESQIFVNPDPVFHYRNKRFCSFEGGYEGRVFGLNIISFSVFRRFVPEFKKLDEICYYQFWLNVVESIDRLGGCCSLFTNGDEADYFQAQRVFDYLNINSVVSVRLAPLPVLPQDLVSELEKMDLVVATRMHAGIKAYALGKAVFPIGWDLKVAEVWESVGFKNVTSPSVILSDNPWSILSRNMVVHSGIKTTVQYTDLDVAQALRLCAASLKNNYFSDKG